jgi:hypothetical protein
LPRRTPEERAGVAEKSVKRIKRKYKVALNKDKRFALGEKEHAREMAIVLKLAGYSHNQIGSVVGISRGQVADMLKEPDTAEKFERLRANLPAAALDLLHGYTIEAVQAIVDVLRKTDDDALILKAAAEILDRAGIGKVSKGEQHKVLETKTTISTDDNMLDALRSLPPEKQEEAAQMIEQLENFLTDESKEGS